MNHDQLVTALVESGVLQTPPIIAAFRAIDRRHFVPADLQHYAYQDHPLPIGHGQTISQPTTVAFMLEQLQPAPGDQVLDIGTGSGWQAALLGHIVSSASPAGSVTSIEVIPELSEQAEKNISTYGFIEQGVVKLLVGNARQGMFSHESFTGIIAAAAGETIPADWQAWVKTGGKIVAPVGNTMHVLTKKADHSFTETLYPGFSFVPLV